MPKVLDNFAGHMPEGDPRHQLWGAAGCVWPTVAPYKAELKSDDATFDLLWLRLLPIPLKPAVFPLTHDSMEWTLDGGPAPVTNVTVTKLLKWPPLGFVWIVVISLVGGGIVRSETHFTERKCNQTLALNNAHVQLPGFGQLGDTFRIEHRLWND